LQYIIKSINTYIRGPLERAEEKKGEESLFEEIRKIPNSGNGNKCLYPPNGLNKKISAPDTLQCREHLESTKSKTTFHLQGNIL
jgi:hypothetical protein